MLCCDALIVLVRLKAKETILDGKATHALAAKLGYKPPCAATAIVTSHRTIRCNDTVARYRRVVIRAHDSADSTGCFWVTSFRRDFFVCHGLPFRYLPNHVAYLI
jgi:hypothetical protein